MADWIRIVPVVAAVFMADAVQMLARRPAHHSTCSPLAAFSKITTAPSSGLPAFIEHALTVTAQPKTTSCAQKNQMVYLLIGRVAAWQSVMLLSDSFFVVVVVDTAATGPLLFRHHSNWRRREKKPTGSAQTHRIPGDWHAKLLGRIKERESIISRWKWSIHHIQYA